MLGEELEWASTLVERATKLEGNMYKCASRVEEAYIRKRLEEDRVLRAAAAAKMEKSGGRSSGGQAGGAAAPTLACSCVGQRRRWGRGVNSETFFSTRADDSEGVGPAKRTGQAAHTFLDE